MSFTFNSEEDAGKVTEKYRKKAIHRCYSTFELAVNECKSAMEKSHENCLKSIKIPLVKHLICAAFKVDLVCNAANLFDQICEEAPEVSRHDQGRYTQNLKNIEKDMKILNSEVNYVKVQWHVPVKTKISVRKVRTKIEESERYEKIESDVHFFVPP